MEKNPNVNQIKNSPEILERDKHPRVSVAEKNQTESSEDWKTVREAYRADRVKVLEAQEAYYTASKTFEEKRSEVGVFKRFFDDAALEEEKYNMLGAQKKYDALLEALRGKRQERMDAFLKAKAREGTSEKAARYVARHEAILDRQIDDEVHKLEMLRYSKESKPESRHRAVRFMQGRLQWYRSVPRSKKILVGAGIAGIVGASLVPAGVAAGSAAVAAGTYVARRTAGGFFGAIIGGTTKRIGDKLVEAQEAKKMKAQKETFTEKQLSESRRERLAIKQRTWWKKQGVTAAAMGGALAGGAGAAHATDMALDTLIDIGDTAGVDAGKEHVAPKKGHYNEPDAKQEHETDTKLAQEGPSKTPSEPAQKEPGVGSSQYETPDMEESIPEHASNAVPTEPEMIQMHKTEEGFVEELQPEHPRAQEHAEELKEQLERNTAFQQAHLFATQMGIEDTGGLNYKLEGGVPTEINGRPVPMELLSEEQRTAIETARHMNGVMEEAQQAGTESNESVSIQESAKEEAVPPEPEHSQETKTLTQEASQDEAVTVVEDPPLRVTQELVESEKEILDPPLRVTADEAAGEEGVELADLYKELGFEEEPETDFKMEGIYEGGSSVEREIQQFLEDDSWIQEHYSDLTESERGKIAHRIRLELEKIPEMAEQLKVQDGDWDKVLKDSTYSLYIDHDLVTREIDAIHGAGEVSSDVLESEEPQVVDPPLRTTPEEAEVVPDPPLRGTPDGVPVKDDSLSVSDEPTPDVQQEQAANETATPPSKSVAEEMLESMRNEDPVVESTVSETGEDVADENVAAPQDTKIEKPETESLEQSVAEKIETAPVQEVQEATSPVSETGKGDVGEVVTEAPQETPETETAKTFSQDAQDVKEILKEQGADYQGMKTRVHIESMFKMDDVFSEALRAQRPAILSSWGPMSYARLEDIFDTDNKITYTINGPPITMGAQTEQLCRSIVNQLERGLSEKIPNIDEIIEQGREENITLGQLVSELSDRLEHTDADSIGTEASVVETVSPESGDVLALDDYTEKPPLVKSTTVGIEGAQSQYTATLPAVEVSDEAKLYVEKAYASGYPKWEKVDAKTLFEEGTGTPFHDIVVQKLTDIAIDLRDDQSVPLNSITVDWSAYEGMTAKEALEQLHQHELRLEAINDSETILQPKKQFTN